MKTNTKRVINIILALAMMISLITAFGSVALAAPELNNESAAYDKALEIVTVKVTLAGVEDSQYASLRAINTADGSFLYLNQYELIVGQNIITFPVADEVIRGKSVDIIVCSKAGKVTMHLAIGKATSLRIDEAAAISVKRNTTIALPKLVADADDNPAYLGHVEWTVTNPLMAVVKDGELIISNKTGTAVLSAYDPFSGLSYTIILRIT